MCWHKRWKKILSLMIDERAPLLWQRQNERRRGNSRKNNETGDLSREVNIRGFFFKKRHGFTDVDKAHIVLLDGTIDMVCHLTLLTRATWELDGVHLKTIVGAAPAIISSTPKEWGASSWSMKGPSDTFSSHLFFLTFRCHWALKGGGNGKFFHIIWTTRPQCTLIAQKSKRKY